ncbi:hypothetical protein Ocin01_03625 [Orchesella cincta]|uniref:Gustatory receptor n=1 Tax=Orchesella cincta TaxID=48709 RepID=A0A1D2NCQ8_ORCCI|nr:hypothetical protein Ocin01_03625 [Orchesella cincta]
MMSYFFVSMISSASANAKADTLKDELLRWRAKDSSAHNREDFMILQMELSASNTIGLKGLNYFTATYPFLGVLSPDQNPLQFLNFAENTINLVYAFAWTYALNFKLRDFRILLDLCQKHHRAMTAGSVGCQQSVWKSTLGWQFRVWLYFMIYGFIEEYYSEISANLSGAKVGLTFLPKSVRTCWFVFICYGRAVGESASVLLFSFGWLLKILCEDLKKEILENRTSYANIMERYLDIKAINERINSISETVVLSFCIGSIPFVSDAMMSLSITKPLFSLTFLFSVNNTIISMIGSAGANEKAAELKHALILRTNNKNLPVDENKDDMLRVSILISEFSTPSIGLRGMSFFTVTYGILGMMLSQCVVYALIILQLKLGGATSSMKN